MREAARISKQLATAKRDIPLDIDLAEYVAHAPDRSQLRDTFRQFELREPLRRLEEALGSADAAAPAPAAERPLAATAREVTLRDRRLAAGDRAGARGRGPADAGGRAVRRRGSTGASACMSAGGREVLVGACARPERLVGPPASGR